MGIPYRRCQSMVQQKLDIVKFQHHQEAIPSAIQAERMAKVAKVLTDVVMNVMNEVPLIILRQCNIRTRSYWEKTTASHFPQSKGKSAYEKTSIYISNQLRAQIPAPESTVNPVPYKIIVLMPCEDDEVLPPIQEEEDAQHM
eukprot:15364785-Ditylum_brightwellii.AAC.1